MAYKAGYEVAYKVGPSGQLVASENEEQHGNERQCCRNWYHDHSPSHSIIHDLLRRVVGVRISTVSSWIWGETFGQLGFEDR
jgi:hypothetical protein